MEGEGSGKKAVEVRENNFAIGMSQNIAINGLKSICMCQGDEKNITYCSPNLNVDWQWLK